MIRNTADATGTEHNGSQQKSNLGWTKVKKIFLGGIILLALYFILENLFHLGVLQFLKDLFMLKYFPRLGKDAGYGLLLIVGFLTSFHCAGMCGGIAISQTIPGQETSSRKSRPRAWIVPSILYNSGRVIAYTAVGGIAGGLGQAISFTGIWKGIVPIFGGVFMVIMGINLLGIFPALRRLNLRMPYFAAKKIQRKNNYGPFYIGLLSGLMPCGPLQIVQLYALGTGSVVFGALSMFVFSLGTVPLLFSFGMLNSAINKKYTGRILKASAAFVIILGFVMLGRGLSLSGILLPLPSYQVTGDTSIARIEGNVQTVVTSVGSGSYPPIVVRKGIPVRWIIKAAAGNLNECNNAITLPKFKIDKKLVEGENEIEFIPLEAGEFVYTCWMGMIKSTITVVEDPKNLQDPPEAAGGGMKTVVQAQRDPMKETTLPEQEDMAAPLKMQCTPQPPSQNPASAAAKVKTATPEPAQNTRTSQSAAPAADAPPKQESAADAKPARDPQSTQAEITTFTGFLTDKHCIGLVSPEKETRACLTMEECEASGYGIAVKQEEGGYKFYRFDETGHKLAKELLGKATRNTDFAVTVTGTPEGDSIKVTALLEKNSTPPQQ